MIVYKYGLTVKRKDGVRKKLPTNIFAFKTKADAKKEIKKINRKHRKGELSISNPRIVKL